MQSKVIAFLDVDPEKCGKAYINHHHKNPVAVPVFHHDKVATLFEKEKCIVDSAYGSVPIVAGYSGVWDARVRFDFRIMCR